MKRITLFVLLPLLTAVFFSMRVSGPAAMEFDEVKHNFGMIHQGEVVSYSFGFTNTGDEPLLITDAEVACKCTTVDFPKQPVLKGQKGNVTVTFDSKSAIDRQERTVIVKSTAANSPVTLTFKCVVLKPKN